jgi:hypothetical protein
MSGHADTIRPALPYAADDHHGLCSFVSDQERECDCYAKSSSAAHAALDALVAENQRLRDALTAIAFSPTSSTSAASVARAALDGTP